MHSHLPKTSGIGRVPLFTICHVERNVHEIKHCKNYIMLIKSEIKLQLLSAFIQSKSESEKVDLRTGP